MNSAISLSTKILQLISKRFPKRNSNEKLSEFEIILLFHLVYYFDRLNQYNQLNQINLQSFTSLHLNSKLSLAPTKRAHKNWFLKEPLFAALQNH